MPEATPQGVEARQEETVGSHKLTAGEADQRDFQLIASVVAGPLVVRHRELLLPGGQGKHPDGRSRAGVKPTIG